MTNVVFIMFDDLRPELSIYGRHHMITPNFERLAKRSVVFDYAFAQISVCNPSRDSLLTGLRPDTVGTYAFQSSFRPHMILPQRFAKAGYNTAGFGKVAHWETGDKDIWNTAQWDNKWYEYQWSETKFMNASTMPDKHLPEEQFRDALFTTRFIHTLGQLAAKPKPFLAALGFKLPHLAVHVPWKYYAMYRDSLARQAAWKLRKKELRFPPTAPAVAYRCCAVPSFHFMVNEGQTKSYRSVSLNDINMPFTDQMRDEIMLGYAAAVTFVDSLLGRILDAMDALGLWDNTTLVLTADHGMHNGEKGIWEKWSMFDESTRVPLIIHHPQSPNKGQHYRHPVELVDIFPTIQDLANPSDFDRNKYCKPMPQTVPAMPKGGLMGALLSPADLMPAQKIVQAPYMVCRTLQGKSLAEVVLGPSTWRRELARRRTAKAGTAVERQQQQRQERQRRRLLAGAQNITTAATEARRRALLASDTDNNNDIDIDINSILLPRQFAISQSWRCSPQRIALDNKNDIHGFNFSDAAKLAKRKRQSKWLDCDKTKSPPNEMSLMGYSVRTSIYRYTAWYLFDRAAAKPLINEPPFEEEFYDHRNETLEDFTHREYSNLVFKPSLKPIVKRAREQLTSFIRTEVIFRGPFIG